jgi:phage host-nuclease inhibitor protein Gam
LSANKKSKFQPLLITSKDGLTAAINQVVSDKLEAAALQVEMEQDIAKVQERYQRRLEPLLRDIATAEAGIQVFVEQHRESLLPPGLKSLDLQLAVVGFRDTPFRVEKTRSKDTWEQIALRLAAYREYGAPAQDGQEPPVTFNGEDYVRYSDPALDKKALITDRAKIPASVLKAVGIKFDRDELYYLEPKSQVIEGTTEAVA